MVGGLFIGTAGAPGDGGTSHRLHRHRPRQRPQVGIRNPRVFGLHRLQKVTADGEPGVGAPIGFWGEPHGGAVGSSRAGGLIVGTRGVPCETDQDRSVTAVVVVYMGIYDVGNGFADGVVVGGGGGLGEGGGDAQEGVEKPVYLRVVQAGTATGKGKEQGKALFVCRWGGGVGGSSMGGNLNGVEQEEKDLGQRRGWFVEKLTPPDFEGAASEAKPLVVPENAFDACFATLKTESILVFPRSIDGEDEKREEERRGLCVRC